VCIYVDDLLIVGDPAAVTSFKRLLLSEFTMTDFGDAKQFLGFEIHRNRIGKRLLLTQTQYTKDLLERYTFPSLWPNPIPANPKRDLSIRYLPPPDATEIQFMKTIDFHGMIGSLLYLTNTRPDIAAALSPLCRYVKSHRRIHYDAIRQIFAYLLFTQDRQFGLLLSSNSESSTVKLDAFSDANWGTDTETRRSRSGTILRLNGSTISARSNYQNTIALSSNQAELIASNECAKDIMWARQFLTEIGFNQQDATELHCDNMGAIAISTNDTLSKSSRHLDIKLLWLRELIGRNEIRTKYCPTSEMIADILTKPLPRPAFERSNYLKKQENF
jgi:hypothetical protein